MRLKPSMAGAAAAGLALVAGRRGVVEVGAARPLHQVAADRRHVAQLRRGAREDRLATAADSALDLRVVGDVGVRAPARRCAVRRPASASTLASGKPR